MSGGELLAAALITGIGGAVASKALAPKPPKPSPLPAPPTGPDQEAAILDAERRRAALEGRMRSGRAATMRGGAGPTLLGSLGGPGNQAAVTRKTLLGQ